MYLFQIIFIWSSNKQLSVINLIVNQYLESRVEKLQAYADCIHHTKINCNKQWSFMTLPKRIAKNVSTFNYYFLLYLTPVLEMFTLHIMF